MAKESVLRWSIHTAEITNKGVGDYQPYLFVEGLVLRQEKVASGNHVLKIGENVLYYECSDNGLVKVDLASTSDALLKDIGIYDGSTWHTGEACILDGKNHVELLSDNWVLCVGYNKALSNPQDYVNLYLEILATDEEVVSGAIGQWAIDGLLNILTSVNEIVVE